jgi:hypothetical protein
LRRFVADRIAASKGPERITILKDLGRPSLEIYGLLPYEARPSPFEQAQLTSRSRGTDTGAVSPVIRRHR